MFLVPPPSTSITFIVRIARDEQRFDYRRQSGNVRAAVLLAAVSDARISAMDDRRPASGRHSALAMNEQRASFVRAMKQPVSRRTQTSTHSRGRRRSSFARIRRSEGRFDGSGSPHSFVSSSRFDRMSSLN